MNLAAVIAWCLARSPDAVLAGARHDGHLGRLTWACASAVAFGRAGIIYIGAWVPLGHHAWRLAAHRATASAPTRSR